LKQPEDAIKTYDEIMTRFGSSSEPEIQQTVADALFNKGIILARLKQPEEEIKTYDEIMTRFGSSSEPGIQQTVA